MFASVVSESDVPRELFKNMNSLVQPTLSRLESPEMGPSTSFKKKKKTSPEDPGACHRYEIIIIMKPGSRSREVR